MKRSKKAAFMANMFVFPGGGTNLVDKQSKWMDLFKTSGIRKHQLDGLRVVQTNRPFIYDRDHLVHKSGARPEGREDIERFISSEMCFIHLVS